MSAEPASFDIGHPAPYRGRIGLGLVAFALFGAPAAWSLQHLVMYGISSVVCFGRGHSPAWLVWLLPLVNLAALLAAAAATAAAVWILRRTREEEPGRSRGMLDAGEGRTRFMAVWGLWIGILFIVAIAFNTLSAFWIGLCNV